MGSSPYVNAFIVDFYAPSTKLVIEVDGGQDGVARSDQQKYEPHRVWWVKTSELWSYKALLEWFIRMYRDVQPAAIAAGLLQRHSTILVNGFSFVADDMLVA